LVSGYGTFADGSATKQKIDRQHDSTSISVPLNCGASFIPESEQVKCAYIALQKMEVALNKEVLLETKAFPNPSLVLSVETSWNHWSVGECRLDNSPYAKGSAYSLLIVTCQQAMDNQRIQTIKELIKSLHK